MLRNLGAFGVGSRIVLSFCINQELLISAASNLASSFSKLSSEAIVVKIESPERSFVESKCMIFHALASINLICLL